MNSKRFSCVAVNVEAVVTLKETKIPRKLGMTTWSGIGMTTLLGRRAALLGFAQGEFAGYGAAFVIGLHHHGRIGQSGFIDLD